MKITLTLLPFLSSTPYQSQIQEISWTIPNVTVLIEVSLISYYFTWSSNLLHIFPAVLQYARTIHNTRNIWKLGINANCCAPQKSVESKTLFQQMTRWFWCMLKLENHQSRVNFQKYRLYLTNCLAKIFSDMHSLKSHQRATLHHHLSLFLLHSPSFQLQKISLTPLYRKPETEGCK